MDFDTFLKRVGKNVQRARHLRGLTLEQATSGRGGYRYLWELEQGARNPSLQKLFELSLRFDVTVADLVNVRGARPHEVPLADRPAEPPKRGRKPKKRSKTSNA